MFDNDGTLWCEKPMPIQLDFILRRLVEMAEARPGAARAAAVEGRVRARLRAGSARVMAEHYAGDDTNVRIARRRHPGRVRRDQRRGLRGSRRTRSCAARSTRRSAAATSRCAYAPMVELLGYLEANGFTNYIVSGGGRDFMRPISQDVYGIPRERVIGSSSTFAYTSDERGGTITHKPEADYLDDGPEKPIRIWSRTGRRPLLAAGNSNGDVPMLAVHRSTPTSRRCGCSSCTTTPSASSTTPPAPSRRSNRPQTTGGPSSASRRLDHRLLIALTASRCARPPRRRRCRGSRTRRGRRCRATTRGSCRRSTASPRSRRDRRRRSR